MSRSALVPVAITFVFLIFARHACGERPLHRQIDALIAQQQHGEPAAVADDLAFLRRVSLDFAGRIPTLDEIRRFEELPIETRRQSTIDRLLNSQHFVIHMSSVLDIMFMERRGGDPQWDRFLRLALADDLSWTEMGRHLVNPQADDAKRRGAAVFIVKRLERYGQNPSDMPGLVRDVGRLFLGRDVQCAQCHDHLYIDDYKQVDYQGLFAFLGQAEIRRDTPFPAVNQKLMTKKVEFTSVFEGEPRETGPRLPGRDELAIPSFPKGEEYETPPDRKTRYPGLPKFQPLAALAEQLVAPDNEDYARNFANRMWWYLMGRGLVHPLDLHHADNPPTHPELLELLAAEAKRNSFNLRWLLREIALSDAYQRASRHEADLTKVKPSSYLLAFQRPLSAEQLCRSVETALQAQRPTLPPCETAEEELWPVDPDRLAAFRSAFANPPKDPEVDYRPSVKGALFLMNSDVVLSQLEGADKAQNGAVGQLARLDDIDELATQAYLRVLTRRPISEEVDEIREFATLYGDSREAMAADVLWSLLTSTEFLVNH